MRKIFSILTVIFVVGFAFPNNQTGITRVFFSDPVFINDRQANILRQAAGVVEKDIINLTEKLIKPSGSSDSLVDTVRQTLIIHIDQRTSDIRGTQAEFETSTNTQEVREASRIFFGDIENHYGEAKQKLKSLEKGQYPLVRDFTLGVFEHNYRAYIRVADTHLMSFDLAVKSSPRGATITLKRKGDHDYLECPDPTNTTCRNVVKAIWYVRAQLDGYKDLEKTHNPFTNPDHDLYFEMKPK
jgi:hypothetical protein